VRAQRVALGVSGRSLGMVRSHPSIEDELFRAFSRAVATNPADALHELTLHWGRTERDEPADYRRPLIEAIRWDSEGLVDAGGHLSTALEAYLDARASAASGIARTVELTVARASDGVEVTVVQRAGAPRSTKAERAAIDQALQDLCAGPRRERVRVLHRDVTSA
jgi:hypothetical protein